MNVFYPETTQGLKEIPDFTGNGDSQTVYFTDSAVYSICSEGTLYVSPRYVDGSFDVDEWVEVDFMAMLGEEPIYMEAIHAIQDCLIADAQRQGIYYTTAA